MSASITRHFVNVGTRRVHYTRAGDGPPLVLLHESPCSSKAMAVYQLAFAEHFTAIAFDTPGFGLSDPLSLDQPEIADFADALAEALDALGVARTAVFGRHTGASIAVEFARRHSDRCAVAVVDGYPIYSSTQRQRRLTNYLTPLQPSWEGAHLLWLWFRYRDQHVFWPWNDHDAAHRSDADVPPLDYLHRGVVELLEAGDGYRIPYAAAFRHGGQALDVLPHLRVPVCFAVSEGDSLFRTLTLFPAGTWTASLPRDKVAAARVILPLLLCHPISSTALPPARIGEIPGRTTCDYVEVSGGQLLVRSAGAATDVPPVVVLHDVPGSSALLDPLIIAVGQHRRTLAFDLPGQGESMTHGATPDVATWAKSVLEAMGRLGVSSAHLYAHGTGGVVGVEIAARAPHRVASLILGAPPTLPPDLRARLAPDYAPSAAPEWDGSHLLRVWHHLRDQELWWPWTDRTRAAVRQGEPDIDPEHLNLRARECLKQAPHYRPAWQSVLSYPLQEKLAALSVPVVTLAAERDLFGRYADAAAVRIADGWDARASAILASLPN